MKSFPIFALLGLTSAISIDDLSFIKARLPKAAAPMVENLRVASRDQSAEDKLMASLPDFKDFNLKATIDKSTIPDLSGLTDVGDMDLDFSDDIGDFELDVQADKRDIAKAIIAGARFLDREVTRSNVRIN